MARRIRFFKPGTRAQARRKARLIRTGIGVVVVLVLIGGAAWLSHIEGLEIQTITVSGHSVITEAEIRETVARTISGTYPLWFARDNIALYPANGVRAALHDAFPRIREVVLAREDMTTLAVSVTEREPHALWCGENFIPIDEITGACHFVDENGFIFAKAPDFTGTVFFRYFGAIPDGEPLGTQFLPTNEFRNLTFFLETLESELKEPAFALSVIDGVEYEVRLENGGMLLFKRNQDFGAVLQNTKAAFRSEAFEENDRATLNYLDLRFGNKVYFKFE